MRTPVSALPHRALGAWLAFTTLVLVLGTATRPASAQTSPWPHARAFQGWTDFDTHLAWTAYNQNFNTSGANGGAIFSNAQGGTTFCLHCFWEEVEEIEVAEDAYDWAKIHDAVNLRRYADEINDLCAGFIDNTYTVNRGPNGPYDLSGDKFNDDLDWAVMAFTRAYRMTHNANWLTAAELNFNTVWTRAQAPGGQGNGMSGLIQSQPHGKNWKPNLDSPVNFTFVIAGYLIYDTTHDREYMRKADNVYQWSITHLYTISVGGGACKGHPGLTCAKIYDSTTGHSDYTYNYGIAIQAASREKDFTKVQYITNWLMYNSNNPNFPYVGTYNGYNILPNYHQGGNNDDGYNGIALRGVGYAIARGILDRRQLAWAQANVAAAWRIRNSEDVMWNNWTPDDPSAVTPSSGLYSWDCSPALVGMFDIPAPIGNAVIKGQPPAM